MRFEALVERLKASPLVDGLMLIGSSAQGALNEHSDRDERVWLYGDLVEATIEPTGFSWRDGDPMLRISPSELMTYDNLRSAQSFWRSILHADEAN